MNLTSAFVNERYLKRAVLILLVVILLCQMTFVGLKNGQEESVKIESEVENCEFARRNSRSLQEQETLAHQDFGNNGKNVFG